MTNRFSRRAIACALFASTALASPAFAQPLHRNLDANGVDLVQGDFQLNFKEGSIGSGAAELALIRLGWTGDFSQWDRITFHSAVTGGVSTYTVGLPDGSSDVFTGSGFNNVKANGASLNNVGGNMLYTAADGTQILFVDPTGGSQPSNFCGEGGTPCDLVPQTMTYPDGHKITFVWGTKSAGVLAPAKTTYSWRLLSITNSFGYAIKFTYKRAIAAGYPPPWDWFARSKTEFQRAGVTQETVTYSYPTTSTDPVDVTDAAGNTWHITDSSITRPGESTPFLQASGPINVTSVTNNGVTTSYNRVVSGSTATMTVSDALSHSTVVTSDLNLSQPISITDPLSRTTTYGYDGNGRPTQVTKPEGNYTQYTYDARGNVTQVTQVAKSGSGLANLVTSASFDSSCANVVKCNKPNSTTDAKGNETDYVYDATHGGVTSITQPAPTTGAVRPQRRYSYAQITSSSGDLVYMLTGVSACQMTASCTGTTDEVKSSASYDAYGNMTSQSSGDGSGALIATRGMTYDAMGDLLTLDGPLTGTGDTTTYRYDAARRLTGAMDPDPDGPNTGLNIRAVQLTYRPDGQVSKKELGTITGSSTPSWSTFTVAETLDIGFDANGRPITNQLSAGGTAYSLTQTNYDANGRLNCTAVRMNPAIYSSLPSDACSPGTAGSYGNDRISQTVYDNAGEVTQLKEAVGSTSDAATGRTLTYSNNGNLATLLDGENNLTTYVYDGFDRLSQTQYPNTTKGAGTSNSSDYEQLSYDANGNVTSRRLRDGNSIGFTFDNLNRVTFKDLPGTEPDVTTAYDNLGRPTSISQSGNSLSFTYDALGRKLTESGPQGTASSAYDLAGNRTQITYPGTGLYVNFDYLANSAIKAIRENGASSGVGVLASYGYDDLGRRTSITFGNGASQGFTYDGVSRLASLTNDLSGTTNDLSATFSYNPANQILSTVRTGDAYAFSGNADANTAYSQNGLNQQVSIGGSSATWDTKGNITSDPTTAKTYSYSSENLLTSASGGVTLGYDPAMRLYQVAGAATTRFAYDGVDAIAEYDGSNALQRRFVFAPGVDQPIVQYEGTGTSNRRFLSSDERGSIISLTDSSGTLIGINSYDEYGRPGASNQGRFQYTGQKWISEIGAYDYKARAYLPHLGMFAQTDPSGYGAGANLYAYALRDPVGSKDPFGLETCTGSHLNYDSCGTPGISCRGQCPTLAPATKLQTNVDLLSNKDSGSSSGPFALTPDQQACVKNANACLIPASNPNTLYVPNSLYHQYQESFLSASFTGSALQLDPFHSIARNPIVLQNAVATGTMFYIQSSSYFFTPILLQAEFGYGGKTGIVEYIMPMDWNYFIGRPNITHARFVPGAPISGYPNNDNLVYPPAGVI